ncbi:MAG: hypothetical protein AAF541_10515 [Pseudomonadota bacterium]
MKKFSLGILIALSTTANASTIVVNWEGTVTGVIGTDAGNPPIGSTISGQLIIDTSLADTVQPSGNGQVRYSSSNSNFVTANTPLPQTGGDDFRDVVVIQNGLSGIQPLDNFFISDAIQIDNANFVGSQFVELVGFSQNVNLFDGNQLADLVGLTLDNSGGSIGSGVIRTFLRDTSLPSNTFIDGRITFGLSSVNISAVPLPAAAWLFLTAIGGLFELRKYQNANVTGDI